MILLTSTFPSLDVDSGGFARDIARNLSLGGVVGAQTPMEDVIVDLIADL